ncbi:hypothetical protein [Sporolactobacillus sp. KGMB 08714]|uniref:hypothetical protein n=1 Tax=Sporolactobacillus sp. KGMB 08714 TaxID=3064704 RepID=UPI002FBDCE04
MKKIMTAVILTAMLMLAACGSGADTAYNQAMKEGLNAVTAGNYDHAATAFETALADKKADKQATALLAETQALKSAEASLKKGDLSGAIDSAGRLINRPAVDHAVLTQAQEIRDRALKNGQKETGSTAAIKLQPAAESVSGSSGTSAGGQAGASAAQSADSGGSSAVSGSSQPGSSVHTVTQAEAEAAVIKAAGYSPDQVYIDTTNDGAYYSIELRENHQNDSAADPNTAPAIGFFRYYKASGKIAKLDMISNTYKYVN